MRGCWWALVMTVMASSLFAGAQEEREFALKLLSLKGQAELVTASPPRSLEEGATVSLGDAVRVAPKSVALFLWLPYKARLKVESEGQVRLLANRVLQVEAGRIWLGTPPPPPGERRYPLPVRVGDAQLVGSPDAYFSVAVLSDKRILVSVDQGVVFISLNNRNAAVGKGEMAFLLPNGLLLGPMPMSRDERMRWDAGGAH
jgi:hypothetical protein